MMFFITLFLHSCPSKSTSRVCHTWFSYLQPRNKWKQKSVYSRSDRTVITSSWPDQWRHRWREWAPHAHLLQRLSLYHRFTLCCHTFHTDYVQTVGPETTQVQFVGETGRDLISLQISEFLFKHPESFHLQVAALFLPVVLIALIFKQNIKHKLFWSWHRWSVQIPTE